LTHITLLTLLRSL